MKNSFEYSEDEEFFDGLFKDQGGIESNMHHYDFRTPVEKGKFQTDYGHLKSE